jgi:hypothetical protein
LAIRANPTVSHSGLFNQVKLSLLEQDREERYGNDRRITGKVRIIQKEVGRKVVSESKKMK